MLRVYYCFGLVVCVDLVCGFSFVFLDHLIGLLLSTVGFACALVHIKAIAVACWDPGIVPRHSSSVVFKDGSGELSSLEEPSRSFSLFWSSVELLLSAIKK